ncbi:MAG: hypothetical protein IPN33_08980 [Saprospiraceae bacterium]|nr:hypothetical protein [Saprospiraceae bacterium]
MKNIALIAFVLTCAAQWFVPAKMIWQRERILDAGVAYKFKTAPLTPATLSVGDTYNCGLRTTA